jgi:membrane protease YdiL (CAAX protease family)
VLSFYVLAFAIAWLGMFLVIGGPTAFPGSTEQVERLFLAVMLTWFAGPSIASLLLTVLLDGWAGLRQLFARMTKWRVHVGWYGVALLCAPLVSIAVSMALSLTSPAFLPNILTTGDKAGLLAMAIAYSLIGGGLLEELGWTGFAVPRLLPRHGILVTGLIVGVLWGAYHFSVIYWSSGTIGVLPLAVLAAQLFAWLPAFRVLMVWVYERTHSLLLAMLMHAAATASMFILQPMSATGLTLLAFILAYGAAFWLLVAASRRRVNES